MKRNRIITAHRAIAVFGLSCFLIFARCGPARPTGEMNVMDGPPSLFPFSHGTVIPPNIAPLNFVIQEQGERFFVSFSGTDGDSLAISSRTPTIVIPAGRWRELLLRERGGRIGINVSCYANKTWRSYRTVWDTVATDEIDPFVAYRKIPVCEYWSGMGIYQRDVRNFNEAIVIQNKATYACFNCHSFANNSPAGMVLEVRSPSFGTPMLLGRIVNGKIDIRAVNTKAQYSTGKVGFTTWHPSGSLIAFSMNKFKMIYLAVGAEPRTVFDSTADVALYDVASNRLSSAPDLSRKERIETMPEWSRDGRFLYFCSAAYFPESQFDDIKCDLLRIAFDLQTKSWGAVDTVLTARQAGGSVLQPRISPDGRFILVNIAEYGDFPIDKAGTRLGLLDCKTSSFHTVDSPVRWTDSWHGWSSNGKWIVFNSKRLNGRFSTICFSFVDSAGTVHAPFTLPQKQPSSYGSSLYAYNVPECLTERIPFTVGQITKALNSYRKNPGNDAVTAATGQ